MSQETCTHLLPSSLLPPISRGQSTPPNNLPEILKQLRRTLPYTSGDDVEVAHASSWLSRVLMLSCDAQVLDEAADLLSLISAGGVEPRQSAMTYRFQLLGNDLTITIQETSMADAAATGFRTWSSAIWLSRRICADPGTIFPQLEHQHEQKTALKLLELGSGTGLVGITASLALRLLKRNALFNLSDNDEMTLQTLRQNMALNALHEGAKQNGVEVNSVHLDWRAISQEHLGLYDVLLGADLVYEPEHATWLLDAATRLMARKTRSVFHLVVVKRFTHESDIAALEKAFTSKNETANMHLCIVNSEDIEADENDQYPYPHRYYEIRWRNLLTN